MSSIRNIKPGTMLTVGEIPLGGIIPSNGNGILNKTGNWRTERPIFFEDRCTNCLLCWLHCPDSSILLEAGKVVGIDADHCKGCGICAAECGAKPDKALEMVQGGGYQPDETFARHTL